MQCVCVCVCVCVCRGWFVRATYRFFLGLRRRIRIRLRQREREFRVRARWILGGSNGYRGNRHICTHANTNCARMHAQTGNECTITCHVRRHGLEKPLDLQLHTRATSKHNEHKLCMHAQTDNECTITCHVRRHGLEKPLDLQLHATRNTATISYILIEHLNIYNCYLPFLVLFVLFFGGDCETAGLIKSHSWKSESLLLATKCGYFFQYRTLRLDFLSCNFLFGIVLVLSRIFVRVLKFLTPWVGTPKRNTSCRSANHFVY